MNRKEKKEKIQIAVKSWTEFSLMSDLPESRVLVRGLLSSLNAFLIFFKLTE